MVKKASWNWKGTGAALLAAGLATTLAGCNNGGGGAAGMGTVKDTVATVGGEDLTRGELYQHLEATHGPDGLQQLIDYTLVMQNLKSKQLDVSDAEVAANIAERKAKEKELDKIVQAGGPRLKALQRQTRYQLAIDKLLTQDVKKLDEAGLKAWFEKTRKYYDQPENVKFGILQTSSKTRADLMLSQLKNPDKTKAKSFLQLVQEQQKAKDQAATGSVAEVSQMVAVENLPDNIKQALAKVQKNGVSNVITLSQNGPGGQKQTFYAILRLTDRTPGQKADFTKLKTQIEEDYKLEQVARKVVAQIPGQGGASPWDQILPGVRAQVASGSPTPPTYSEMLRFIINQLPQDQQLQGMIQSPINQLVSGLRTSAKVEIKDTDYTAVGEAYKTVPGLGESPAGGPPAGAENAAPAENPAPAAPAPAQ